MIKAVLFDFGQTLVNSAPGFRLAEKDAQTKLFSDISLTLKEDFLTIYRRLRREFHEKSKFSRKLLWQEVYFYYCREPDLIRLELWEAEYWDLVKTHTTPFPEANTVLASLSKDYRIALITNTQGQQEFETHRMNMFPELNAYFDVVIVAGEKDIPTKPDPKPFGRCLEDLKVKPKDAVYVGDDWRIDICGARDAGLHPVWLKHHSVRRNWPNVHPDIPVITSLEPLLDIYQLLNSVHP
jgi:FMN phosphatase YigB (HAD superfamily)